MDFISTLKNAGGVAGTITTLVYVSGYLALRARAFTLGIDPLFSLAYEGYVFAGFRFVFISLIILLLLSPLILCVRSAARWLHGHISAAWLERGQWLLLFMVALGTLQVTAGVVSVNGILLLEKINQSHSVLEGAVMGDLTGFVLMLALFLATTLSVLWLKIRLRTTNDPFTWVLGIVVALQLFLLPIFYGSLYADRKVRVLAATPESVKGFREPLGIIDRTSNHVTLLGLNTNNERRLVTIKLEDLNGIPIKEIVSLNTFVRKDLAQSGSKSGAAQPEKAAPETAKTNSKTEGAKGFFKQLITQLHVTFENIGSLADTVVAQGQVWSVELDPSGRPAKPGRISTARNLAWPVLDHGKQIVYAIQEERIVRLDKEGHVLTDMDRKKKWIKLFGVTADGDILGMIHEGDESRLAIRHADGRITLPPAPRSDEELKYISILEQENRVYDGNRTLYMERSARGGRGFDIFLKTGQMERINLSDCGDDRCGQPSLSPDFRRVLYIRKSRY